MARAIGAFFVAVVVTYIVAVNFVSQWNIASVEQLGLAVGVGDRLRAAAHDVSHMYDIYLPLIIIGLFLGLLVAWLLVRYIVAQPLVLYPLAGFVALLSIHIALRIVFEVSALAPTRELSGLLSQGLAGAVGGYAFYRITQRGDNAA